MSLTISPYLLAPLSGRQPPSASSAPEATNVPQQSAPADKVTLSPAAQQAMARPTKTQLENALERILTGVKTSTGPTLTFGAAPDASTAPDSAGALGRNLDQSC